MDRKPTYQLKEEELLALVDKNRALDATYKLIEIVLATSDFDEMVQKIADIIPMALGYELAILFLIDDSNQKLTKAAISNTIKDEVLKKEIEGTILNVDISLGYDDNLCVQAVKDKKQQITDDLYNALKPSVRSEHANNIQSMLKTKTNVVTPLVARDIPIGALVVSIPKTEEQVSDFEKEMLRKFCENAGIALENSRLLKNLTTTKENLSQAYENLKVLNKMKDEFLTVASHELRTPMTIVKSYLWMLQKQKSGKLNGKQNEYLNKAISGTERMIALINDMLDISKFEQNKVTFILRQVDICNIINNVLTNFEIKAKNKGIKLVFDENCKDIFVDADIEKIEDVIMNLVDNGIKFTDKGTVNVGVDTEKDRIRVWIKDTGSGVNPEDITRLFHKFGRIDESYTIASDTGGTGLGLYIVKLYIEGMGGNVGVDSEGKGKGSTFWFTLPKSTIKTGDESKQIDVPIQDISSIK
ncbi:MAG: GAF domain-containing sensor histidine kinase [Patescibacteria group bacterium]